MKEREWRQGLSPLVHHAYCLEGDRALILPELLDFLTQELSITVRGNPDFSLHESETYAILDARELAERVSRGALTGGKKIFVIVCHAMTTEAQNALLKTFEEPTPHTHFFLLLPSAEFLLPTLRSRLFRIQTGRTGASGEAESFVSDFLHALLPERLEMVGKLAKDIRDERRPKNYAIELVGILERASKKEFESGKNVLLGAESLRELMKAEGSVRLSGSSVKIIFEHLSLILPLKAPQSYS